MEHTLTCTKRGQLRNVEEGQEEKLMHQQGGWDWGTTGRRFLSDGLKNTESANEVDFLKNITGNHNLS